MSISFNERKFNHTTSVHVARISERNLLFYAQYESDPSAFFILRYHQFIEWNAGPCLVRPNATSLHFAILKVFYLPAFLLLFFGVGITLFSLLLYKLKPNIFKGTAYRFNHWGMEKTGSGSLFRGTRL